MSARHDQRFIYATVAALLLTACGNNPARPGLPSTSRTQAVRPLPNSAGGQSSGLVNPSQEGEFLLNGMRERMRAMTSFHTTVKSYSQGNFKEGKRDGELRRASSEMKLVWAKPARLRIEMLMTTVPIAEGALLVTQDSVSFRVRAKGLLGVIPFTLAATHPGLNTNRNHTINEEAPVSQMRRITAPGAVWTVMANSEVAGTPVKLIQVDNVKRPDPEITREIIGIDPQRMALRRIVGYEGNTRVSEHVLTSFTWDAATTAEQFTL